MLEHNPRDGVQLLAASSGQPGIVHQPVPDTRQEFGACEKMSRAAAPDVTFHDFPRRREEWHGLWSTWTNRYGTPSGCPMQPLGMSRIGYLALCTAPSLSHYRDRATYFNERETLVQWFPLWRPERRFPLSPAPSRS